ncbi:hypothetical protein GIB67_023290 [Kingdonia uniflora]|uniref:Cytochrome P450 n=1 Tax=Kingdonia uniflora TaxID=39325 RepID=A0A7J7MCC0_9MAGN|nr:hypothetical protein GIB67_023290 [Kingdonia uniflora]
MEKLQTLLSSLENSTLLGTILVTLSMILIVVFVINRGRQNWRNAPPGPKGWPIFGYLPYVTNRLHEDLFHLTKTHGPLFSLCMGQKPVIVVSSPEVAREFLKDNDSNFSSRMISDVARCIAYDATTVVFVPNGARWRLLRKIMKTEVFSARAIELLQPARAQEVQGLLRSIHSASQSKTPVNIAETMFVFFANIISNLVCSKSLFDTEKKEGRELKEMFSEILQIIVLPNVSDLIPFLRPFDPQGLRGKIMKIVPRFDKFFDKLVDDRVEERKNGVEINKNGKSDVLDVLLNYRSDKDEDGLKKFSKFDIKGLIADMFVAGIDTTPSTIEWGVTEILRNTDVYKKVLAEFDTVVGKNRFAEETDIPKLGMSRDQKYGRTHMFSSRKVHWEQYGREGHDFEILPFCADDAPASDALGLRMVQYTVASIFMLSKGLSCRVLEDTTERLG